MNEKYSHSSSKEMRINFGLPRIYDVVLFLVSKVIFGLDFVILLESFRKVLI